MSHCEHCAGDCAHCGGCGAAYVLNEGELEILRLLGQMAFLPVARRADDLTPVYCGEGAYSGEEYSIILQCLEKKGLISLDFDKPLKGYDMSAYAAYPIHGSLALTQRGQTVLELLEYQGIT